MKACLDPAVVLRLGAAAALTSCLACTQSPTASRQGAVLPALPDPVDEARALAFAPPAGTTPLDESIAALQEAAGREPAAVSDLVALARAWMRKARESYDPGYHLNADACADLALLMSPGDAGALEVRGLQHLQQHRFREAAGLASKLLAREPTRPGALAMLSDAHLELGQFDEAADAAQRLVDTSPGLPAYARASWLAWLQGDVKGATELAQLAVDAGDAARDPESVAWVLAQAGTIAWNAGQYHAADEIFARALSVVTGYPPALVGQARVALAQDAPSRAVALLESAFAASPLAETAWLLGDARLAAGDATGAETTWAQLRKPEHASDRRTLAAFLATKGREPEMAIRLITEEKAVRGGVATDDVEAWALYRAARLDEARAASDRALSHGTRDASFLYHGGAIRMAQGELEAGRDMIEQSLALNPHFDVTGAAEARALLGGGAT